MKRTLLITAVSDFVLLLPAAVFMAALIFRNLPLNAIATGAQQIVMWYAGRLWTLWVLLLALPFAVLLTGGVVLFRDWTEMPNGAELRLALIRAQPTGLFIMGMTFSAAGILVIVVLHMLAN
jgi:hypothetical protein